ncbi:hypothetical protein [Mesorhizobium sp. YM1C-6-2]|uniref:hypothetical protein n=1 Tax=Mesorhizobium sp. YM1C-6-2 TaxID=1827501 RepID=UPI0011C3D0D7|nr:hypothetical protein [Mesorhizobium sp. YM1C-6-2]
MSTQRLRCRQIVNETKPCDVPGCDHQRSGVGRYCRSHRDVASKRGDPLARLPSRNELAIFKHAIGVYLATDPALAKRISADLGALERTKALPPSFCLSPADIHRKLPQVAKATGLLANWQHREGKTYTEAVDNALALMGWMLVYYDSGLAGGIWRNREAFLRTRAGALLGDFRKTIAGKPVSKEASGATHRHLGKDFVHHATTIYGASFWSSPVTTQDGQDMTLLDYTKLALKAAKLL